MSSPPPPLPAPVLARWVLIGAGVLLLLLVLFLFLWHAVFVLLLLFAGLLVAIFLNGIAGGVERVTGLPPTWSLMVSLLGIVLIGAGATWVVAPQVAGQLNDLSQAVPEAVKNLEGRAKEYPLGRWALDETPDVGDLRPDMPQVMSRATGLVSATVGMLFGLVIVLFTGVYLAVDPLLYTDGVLRLVPHRHRPRAAEVLAAVGYTLRWWLIGQLFTMLCVGILTAIGLWALGINLWFSLGLLAALLEFIPNFGPIIAAAPPVLLALVQDPGKAAAVVVLYLVIQQVESLLISPLVHRKTVKLPPVLTILAQVLLGLMVGPLGLLLATPLTATMLVLVKMLYVEQTLGDDVGTPLDDMDPSDTPPLPKPNAQIEAEAEAAEADAEAEKSKARSSEQPDDARN